MSTQRTADPEGSSNGHRATKISSQAGPLNYYKGFIAGVFSGISKCLVGHPFDTIKVRLQTADKSQFSGPIRCVVQTARNEGVSGFYKGVTPPLVGWMAMDSIMLGSLTLYRRLLNEMVFNPGQAHQIDGTEPKKLPAYGHGIAGFFAGCTVSFIAAPIEHIKARLQIQYEANKKDRLYKGPVDCSRRIYQSFGIRGLYHGLFATLIFRSWFFFWWSSYDIITEFFKRNTKMSDPAINFFAGGLSAQVFWLTSYPSDVVKQRIMTDSLGTDSKYPRWRDAAVDVYRKGGWRGYWRGFVPCALRAFPANASALLAFEAVMRGLG